jgi:hypothetical protein
MTPELEADLKALEKATGFASIKDAYARVQRVGQARGLVFLAQIIPLAAIPAALIWSAQQQGVIPQADWIIPFGSTLAAVLAHTLLFRNSMIEYQRIGAALHKWRAAARDHHQ